ncbi:MAG: SHOCT domain-containing protein [Oscillospiraceae bacterium]|nr:SHOCT domain-containing protein [Oscillospiraceae bacterium]
MSKESYRAEIAPKMQKPFVIAAAVLLAAWIVLFMPLRHSVGDSYEHYRSIADFCILSADRYHGLMLTDEGIIGLIVLAALVVLCAVMYLVLVKSPKQCTLTLTENGISGVKKTLLGSKSVELPFENITSIAVKDGIADKLVGGKTVAIASATGFIRFLGVQNAQEFTERTLAELRAFKEKVKSQPSTAAASSGDDTDKLAKLKSLLDDGVLTQAEYDAKKAEILSRM